MLFGQELNFTTYNAAVVVHNACVSPASLEDVMSKTVVNAPGQESGLMPLIFASSLYYALFIDSVTSITADTAQNLSQIIQCTFQSLHSPSKGTVHRLIISRRSSTQYALEILIQPPWKAGIGADAREYLRRQPGMPGTVPEESARTGIHLHLRTLNDGDAREELLEGHGCDTNHGQPAIVDLLEFKLTLKILRGALADLERVPPKIARDELLALLELERWRERGHEIGESQALDCASD